MTRKPTKIYKIKSEATNLKLLKVAVQISKYQLNFRSFATGKHLIFGTEKRFNFKGWTDFVLKSHSDHSCSKAIGAKNLGTHTRHKLSCRGLSHPFPSEWNALPRPAPLNSLNCKCCGGFYLKLLQTCLILGEHRKKMCVWIYMSNFRHGQDKILLRSTYLTVNIIKTKPFFPANKAVFLLEKNQCRF